MTLVRRYLICFLLMSIPLLWLDRFGTEYPFSTFAFPLGLQMMWWYAREVAWDSRSDPHVYGTKPELGFWF